jgi:hypothetical protein
VVLVELRLKLAVESTDELLSGMLMSQKTISNGCQALVHVGTEVMGAAVKVLLQRVELGLDVADGLGLLNSRAVLLAELRLHVLHEVGEPMLQVRGTDGVASQVADVPTQGGLHGIHVHAEEVESLAHVRREARLGQKGCVQQGI